MWVCLVQVIQLGQVIPDAQASKMVQAAFCKIYQQFFQFDNIRTLDRSGAQELCLNLKGDILETPSML